MSIIIYTSILSALLSFIFDQQLTRERRGTEFVDYTLYT